MKILFAFLLSCSVAHATQGDINGDQVVGLEEAIYALQVSSGIQTQAPVHCDSNPYGGLIFDSCGVCGGDGSTCAGCDGVPNSGLVIDNCGVCDGDNSSCTQDCNGDWGGTATLIYCCPVKFFPGELFCGTCPDGWTPICDDPL